MKTWDIFENKVNESKVLSYCEALSYLWNNKKKGVFLYVKLTNPLLLKTRFPKSGPTYSRQVVNPRHRTPHEQSVAKPETPM